MKPTTFIVRGGGAFPLDMLRYDCCYPRTGEDSAAIEQSGRREVTLVSHRPGAPTVARWQSFNWRVVNAARDHR